MRFSRKMNRAAGISLAVFLLLACAKALPAIASPDHDRQAVLRYTRQAVEQQLGYKTAVDSALLPATAGPWSVSITLYDRGNAVAQAEGYSAGLADAIRAASGLIGVKLLSAKAADLPDSLERGRFRVTVQRLDASSKPRSGRWDLVEYRGKAFEIASPGDVTAVRTLDARLVREKIREQKNYLLRQLDPKLHAFFKRYDARIDTAETDLRTIYTASALWTLLLANDLERDERIVRQIRPIADFLLGMQVPDGDNAGAFYYSIDRLTGQKRPRLVVGTASKTIFTLLELHRRLRDPRYLLAAERAGDWLIRQTEPDGRVLPVVSQTPSGKWRTSKSQSVLYSGQVLTALSRLYTATGKPEYKEAADRIAARLLAKARESRFFVGDDFRQPNTVSTSWLAMAFLSYSRITPDRAYREAVYSAAQALIRLQIRDFSDILNDGRYADTWATSGNGWMNEVLVEVYRQSVADGREDGPDYLRAVTRSTRWLIQNIYSYENSYHIPNPDRARGGSIRNSVEEAVRTDAVCHGGNSLIGYWQILKDNIRFTIPETS